MTAPRARARAVGAAWFVAAIGASPAASALDAPHDALQCEDCHVAHLASYPVALGKVCQACHFAGGPATARKTHSSKTTDVRYGNWDLDCWGCHDPHTQWQNRTYGTAYGKFIYTSLNATVKQISPTDPGPYYFTPVSTLRTVTSSNLEFTSSTGFVDNDAIASDDVCRVCHQNTRATGFAGVYTTTANTHYDFGAASQPGGTCTSCHPHSAGFRVSGCVACHATAQPSTGQYRRAVTGASGDFVRARHHATDGTTTQIVSDDDCAVCHTTGTHRSNPSPSGQGVQLNSPDSLTATVAYDGTGASVEGFCVGCHDADGASAYGGTKPFSDGRVAPNVTFAWSGSSHQATTRAELTGEKCLACHGGSDPSNPTATYDRNVHGASGPSLLSVVVAGVSATNFEEGLCFVCHDGSRTGHDVLAEFQKANAHPTMTFSGRHSPAENATATPAAYGYSATADERHAECPDCHNSHAAKPTDRLNSVSRVVPTNGAAGTAPTYAFVPETDTTSVVEWQLCMKCHSGWTTLRPDTYYAGVAKYFDKGIELNPANESAHPVEAAGTNVSAQMAASLAGGTGLPHLNTTSVVACSDCHNNDSIPTNVSTLESYTALTKGPHGSNAAAGFSPFLLRAPYRTTPAGLGVAYAQADFAFCFICHSPAPFADRSQNTRTDTAFPLHGFHLGSLAWTGSTPGDLNNPASPGRNGGNAICKECHYQLHATKLTYWANGRSNARLVNFAPSISGPRSTGSPVWTQATRTCQLTCHGFSHNPENY